MSDTQDIKAGAADRKPASRLGGQLRETRQSLGWGLPELAASLRIRREYLEAIEEGRMSDLPGTTYALGFVRAYASALGLNGDQMAARFRAENDEVNHKPALSFPAPVPQRGVPAGALMLLGLVILAGAYASWYWVSDHGHTPAQLVPPIPDRLTTPTGAKSPPSPQVASILPTATPSAEAPLEPKSPSAAPLASPPASTVTRTAPALAAAEPAPTAPAAASSVPAAQPPAAPIPPPAGTRIVIKATADTWITVKQKAGPALLNKLMHAGEVFAIPADKTGLTLTTGNAGGTELDVDGTPVPGLGASGMVRRNLPLDADALKTGNLPPIAAQRPRPAPVGANQ